MSIVGGLVGSHHELETADDRGRAVEHWLLRHSWQLVLAGSLAFWALVAAAFYFA